MTGDIRWDILRSGPAERVEAYLAAVRDEAAREAGAKALEDAAVDWKNQYGRGFYTAHLRARAAALRAAPPTEEHP